VQTHLILERLYRLPRRSRRERLDRWARAFGGRLARWLEHESWTLALGIVSLGGALLSAGYYYNKLLVLEYDVQVSWARVEASQQKRSPVTRSLTQLLRYYTRYEEQLMKDVTKLRTDRPGAADRPGVAEEGLGQLLGRLNAVAEQYPNLHLTHTVQQFTSTVVNMESEIASYIMGYNDAANAYSTALNTFPARLFGRVLGFQSYEFYKPEDPIALQYEDLAL
jgi:LemA protein